MHPWMSRRNAGTIQFLVDIFDKDEFDYEEHNDNATWHESIKTSHCEESR